MTRSGRWTLESVALRGVLAFPGESTFRFDPGVQVLEAPNHSGKTSLTMALLWVLTGRIPPLPRINKHSFRLFNHETGEKNCCSVTVTLRSGERQMIIRREYQVRAKDGDGLELDVGETALGGEEAQRRIHEELGVSVGSLEGCGIVLQDFRLKLVTDADSAVGTIVNEMLGLGTLSEVVPVLRQRAADAERGSKEMQAFLAEGDPLRRWEEEQRRLSADLAKRESQALAAGLTAADLENPGAKADAELGEACASLSASVADRATAVEQEVDRLRKEIAKQRQGSSENVALARLQGKLVACQSIQRELSVLVDAWAKHRETLASQQEAGPLDLEKVAAARAKADGVIARNAEQRDILSEENGFLTAAYDHLQAHAGTEKCPVCGNRVSLTKLREQIAVRMGAKIKDELDKLNASDEQTKKERRRCDARLKALAELHAEHEKLVARVRDMDEKTTKALGMAFSKAESLWESDQHRDRALEALQEALRLAERQRNALSDERDAVQQKLARREADLFHPAEQKLNRVRERLLPMMEVAQQLEDHAAGRTTAERRSGDLRALVEEAQELGARLKRIAKVVSEVELGTATAAVQRRLPFISKFFADVAQNPNYTGLDMESDISREAVRYRLRATSSRSPSFADAAGHVLSGGDLSAASVALLVGLASGDAHRLGFLVLDDPAEQMDPNLQARLAKELATALPDRQVIVLTHQPEFAAALASHGARRGQLATVPLTA